MSALEVELAVARDREYLVRAVFRAPAVVSIGTDPRAEVTLPDDQLPEHFDLIHLDDRGSFLAFESDMQIEWQVDGAIRPTAELMEAHLADETPDGWQLGLDAGSKGLVRFGPLRILLKVQTPRDLTIWSASDDGGPACGGCGAPLKWALASPVALSPCQRCGDLNRVGGSPDALELGATRAVPAFSGAEEAETSKPRPPLPRDKAGRVTAPPREPPTVSDGRVRPGEKGFGGIPDVPVAGGDLPTFDGIEGPDGAKLPTFDGIEGPKDAGLPTFDGIEGPKDAGLPTYDGIEAQTPPEPADAAAILARERARPPGDLGPGKGAELPTFDAISAFKGDADLSTRAAIDVMKGGAEDAPPIQVTAPEPVQLGNLAKSPPPEEATDEAPALDPAEESTAPPEQPPPDPIPDDASATRPHKYPAPVDVGATRLVPSGPVDPTPAAADASPAPAPAPAPSLEQPVSAASDTIAGDDAPGTEDDDFMMGRDDGGIRMEPYVLGWVLLGLGLVAGLAGSALLVLAFARYQGLL